jgi:uncharacterized protein YkwD
MMSARVLYLIVLIAPVISSVQNHDGHSPLYDEEILAADTEALWEETKPTFQSLSSNPDVGLDVPHDEVTDEENPADGVPDGKSGTATASPKSGRIEAATEAPKNAAFQVGKALTVEEQQKREVGTTQLSEAHEASPDDIIREAFNADGMTEDVEELEANFFPPGTWEDHQEPQTESLALTDLKAATSQQKQDFLDMHNMYRCMHGVPPVTWSNAVADNAQKYVHGMTRMKHAQSYKITPPAGPAGENLAMGSAGMSAKRATEMWYAEVSNCGPFPGCKDGSRGVTGHFTPIVWKGVKEIGCTSAMQPKIWCLCVRMCDPMLQVPSLCQVDSQQTVGLSSVATRYMRNKENNSRKKATLHVILQ